MEKYKEKFVISYFIFFNVLLYERNKQTPSYPLSSLLSAVYIAAVQLEFYIKSLLRDLQWKWKCVFLLSFSTRLMDVCGGGGEGGSDWIWRKKIAISYPFIHLNSFFCMRLRVTAREQIALRYERIKNAFKSDVLKAFTLSASKRAVLFVL